MNLTSLTSTELAKIYAENTTLNTTIASTNKMMAEHYGCKSNVNVSCTTEELAIRQWANASLTMFRLQPSNVSGSEFLGGDSPSISMSWPNETTNDFYFEKPEFANAFSDGYVLYSFSEDTVRKLLIDETTSLTDPWRAAISAY